MDEATQWLTQWPIWALVALLVSAVFYAGRLTQRVGGLEGRLEQGLARLETRMEALSGELRAELRENRAEVFKAQENVAAVRERVSGKRGRAESTSECIAPAQSGEATIRGRSPASSRRRPGA